MSRSLLRLYVALCFVLYSCNSIDPDLPLDEGREDLLNKAVLSQVDLKKGKKDSSEYIAVFGDIQYYTNPNNIFRYKVSVDWIIRNNSFSTSFNCILHTGDITQTNSITEWESFYKATAPLADSILFVSMIGDHDYTWNGPFIEDRRDTHFSEYTSFPKTTSKVLAWYEDGKMENVVYENTIRGERYDLLVLEFGPRKEVVEWANQYVSSHKESRFILLNHEYLEAGGGLRTSNIKSFIRLQNTSKLLPTELWEHLIKPNDNIAWVLCGHVGGLYAVSLTKNDSGREVPQIQHNIQGSAFRYNNWLMLWEFTSESDSASVSIVNTRTGYFYNNTESLFKFRYRY